MRAWDAYAGDMALPLSSVQTPRLEWLDECGSTNTELVARAADGWPDFSVVATDNQTAGRGRLGRVWVAPATQALAVSVLLRPSIPVDSFGWLPLIAGLAMTRAVDQLLSESPSPAHEVGLKWPNDVQVDGLKVSGLLAELLPSAAGVVIGAGLNLSIPKVDLPTPAATSLTLNGASETDLLDRALSAYLRELGLLYRELQQHAGDAEASGIRHLVESRCNTLGQQIRVELPGQPDAFGRATALDEAGRLCFTRASDGQLQAVAAGDVTHLRYE